MAELNEAQAKILETVAKSSGEITAYQISVELNKEPSAVARSVQLMADNRLLVIIEPKKGVAKPLKLTDKGAFYAVYFCHLNYVDVVKNHPHLEDLSNLKVKQAWESLEKYGVGEIYGKILAEISVQNNLFNGVGRWLLDPLGNDYTRYRHWYRVIVSEMTLSFLEAWQKAEIDTAEIMNRVDWWADYAHGHFKIEKKEVRALVMMPS